MGYVAHGARVTKSTLFVTYDFPKRDTNWNGLSLWRMDMFVRHKLDTNVTHKLKFKFFVAHGLSLWRMDPYATTSPNMFVAYGSIRHTCLWRMDPYATHVCGVWIHAPHIPSTFCKKFKFFPSTLPTFSLYKLHFSHIFSSPLSIFSYSLPTFFSPLPLLHYFPPLHFHSSYLISHLTNYT